ncbi:MAG: MAPEG family protein [Gammaproteobacteria bacterium]|nr:MAPEG family protein [Gammaproteobacteria bacterium]NNF49116.1 MAPEG family protein [Woeseiaceae bacterium]MBT8094530.1 MAPEG family protein [Gammaproteobacteria bacterium]MBT8104277.1 MAPEG family protein [Gammaproteobacteria bacterium]NNK24292.1 MAPEG family protein [Woeseiaceae bacterium]
MEATVIVTFLALAQYVLFGIMVGSMRQKYSVPAPQETGPEPFERMNRVHLNTAEQLIVFIPALWMHALYASPLYGAIIGLFFIAGRFIYRAAYLKDPGSRGTGFTMTFVSSAVLLIWALVAAILEMI